MRTSAAIGIVCLWLSAPRLFAHHGVGGQFDLSKEFEVSGIITEMGWVNPHAYVYFDVTNAGGQTEQWRCELRAAGTLVRSGWSIDMFSAGVRVTILGSPARRESNTCYTQTISFNDGPAIDRYAQLDAAEVRIISEDAGAPRQSRRGDGSPNISGDWAVDQRLFSHQQVIRAFGDALTTDKFQESIERRERIPIQLTEAGQEAAAQPGAGWPDLETDASGLVLQSATGWLSCEPRSIFGDWTFDQHPNRITQTEDEITLQYGFMDTVRTIYLNLDRHPEDLEPSIAGHSIGWWEDDVLVVDTAALSVDHRFGSPWFEPTVRSSEYHIVERFTVNHELQALHRSWIAEDPLFWVNSVSGEDVVRRSDIAWQPYNCDDRTNENVRN